MIYSRVEITLQNYMNTPLCLSRLSVSATSMESVKRLIIILVLFSCSDAWGAFPQLPPESAEMDSSIILENSEIYLEIELKGAQFVDLHLKSNPVNPLIWKLEKDRMPRYAHEDAHYKGHFLCIGNIGKPSTEEIEAGVVMRGEQTGKDWSVEREDDQIIRMESSSPTDSIEISRMMKIHESSSQFLVIESFKNISVNGRATNVLQHATIGPPFLNESTITNTNAKSGFYFKFEYPDPHWYQYEFPIALIDTNKQETTDLRSVSLELNYISRHIFDMEDEFAWVTAYDPATGVLLGYVWPKEDYPWLNFWNASKEGSPTARGLEFGTTGIGGTFDQLLSDSISFHGRFSWEYIDAGETKEKSYLVFMADMGKNQPNPVLSFIENQILIVTGIDTLPKSIRNTLLDERIPSGNRLHPGNEVPFCLYPNPAHDRITVRGAKQGNYLIFNMAGNQLLEGDLSGPLNISSLVSGIYAISVDGQVMRFVKSP